MRKEDLELEVVELRKKVQEQTHLAQAVEAKDKEIIELRKQLDTIRPMAKNAEQLKQQNDVLTQIANGYINNFRNYLKSQQGALDMAIEIEVMLAEKLPKK